MRAQGLGRRGAGSARRAARALPALAALTALVGCQSVLGFEDFSASAGGAAGSGGSGGTAGGGTGGAAGTGGSAGAATGGTGAGGGTGGAGGSAGAGGTGGGSGGTGGGTGGTGAALNCDTPGTPLGGPVLAAANLGDRCLYIDSTEVTWGQYRAFLAAGTRPAQDVDCEWNVGVDGGTDVDALTPSQACALTIPGATGGIPPDAMPVTCVDWCDAALFCAWAGKRLCTDAYAGPSANLPAQNEWYAVCSDDGVQSYPYGAIADPQLCNVYDNATSGCASGGACTLTSAGDLSACSVHGAGDLVGNAAEWVNACNGGGATGKCYFRGGSVTSGAPDCRTRAELARDQVRPYLGFRCCDDDGGPAGTGGAGGTAGSAGTAGTAGAP